MKSRQKVSHEERLAYWRAHVAAWQESGLSQSRYSRENGIRQSALSYWIRRLSMTLTAPALPNIVEVAPAFVVQALRPELAPASLTPDFDSCRNKILPQSC